MENEVDVNEKVGWASRKQEWGGSDVAKMEDRAETGWAQRVRAVEKNLGEIVMKEIDLDLEDDIESSNP